MNLHLRNIHIEVDDSESEVINDRLRTLFDDDTTPTVAFLWDNQSECWVGVAMWNKAEDQGDGVNFVVDGETGALVTAIYTALKEASRD